MRRIVLLLSLMVPTLADAQTVIVKCIDAKGAVIYQSGACAAGQRSETHQVYGAVRDDPYATQRVQQAEREVAARRAGYRTQSDLRVIRPASDHSFACESAKAHRKTVLEAAGLQRTYDLLQQLDENVREACKAR